MWLLLILIPGLIAYITPKGTVNTIARYTTWTVFIAAAGYTAIRSIS